jgi:hypothetical protein
MMSTHSPNPLVSVLPPELQSFGWTVSRRILALACAALCALPADAGTITAWGSDNRGQVSAAPTGDDFTAVEAGEALGIALVADGSIVGWGWNFAGQASNTPAGTGFTAIAAGAYHGYALAADGSIAAWGLDGFGQVSTTPTGSGFTNIVGGDYHGYALTADGSIMAWGYDSDGQVSGTPTGAGFTAIAAGHYHGYALAADGSIAAWGRDDFGQVSNTPTGAGFTDIAAGGFHGYALAADGSIVAWGLDASGQVSGTPTGPGFTAIAGGGDCGYALAADGSIAAWGSDGFGQVSNTPANIGFTAIAAGYSHGYALLPPPPSFCDATDGALASCPCANPGNPDSGCDNAQATGGVRINLLAQATGPNGATLTGTGFSTMGAPTALVIRSNSLDPASPVVFGDGLRCINPSSLVRLAATVASGGTSTHTFGHSAGAGPGTFYYQLWYRNTPSTFCDPFAAFNLSSGRTLVW